ncbi:MAG TPA: 6-bladed beta-propeller [Gammaproteobacteria bacterium]|nr:6-bladed beta-propeller [Gammaproteobacteria bacterium]
MSHQVKTAWEYLLCGMLLIGLYGCATTPDVIKPPAPVYPPAPAKPRYIYEATLRSSSNIVKPTMAEKIQEIATGSRISPSGLGKPYGVAAHKGRVYVTDTQQRAIVMFDLINRQVKFFGTQGPGNLLKPLGIDISKDEEIYVADNTAKRIVVFDLKGNFLRAFGGKKYFSRPVGVATNPLTNEVYVVDTGGIESDQHHVLVFNGKTGEYLTTFGKRGRKEGEFNLPLQASATPDGKLYVVDGGNFRIQCFDDKHRFVKKFGEIGRRGGQFSRPKGIATDKQGNIYVVDTAFGNVQIFNEKGQLLLHIGERNTSGGPGKYSLPAGIDVDENGKIYIVDQFFRKVDIIRPIDSKPFDVFEEK